MDENQLVSTIVTFGPLGTFQQTRLAFVHEDGTPEGVLSSPHSRPSPYFHALVQNVNPYLAEVGIQPR